MEKYTCDVRPKLVQSALSIIDAYMRLTFYDSVNKREYDSPFGSSGVTYTNDTFTVRAYDWSFDDETSDAEILPNFEYKDFKVYWYKYFARDLRFCRENGKITVEFLNQMLRDCLNSIYMSQIAKKT